MKLEKIPAPKGMPRYIKYGFQINLGFLLFSCLVLLYDLIVYLNGNSAMLIGVIIISIIIAIQTHFVVDAWDRRIPSRYLWSDEDGHWEMYKKWKEENERARIG